MKKQKNKNALKRKERKRLRRLSPKKNKKVEAEYDELARELAVLFRQIAEERYKREPKFKMFYCEKCKSVYCIQAMGQDNYCRSCFKFEYREQIEASGGFIPDCDFKSGGKRVCLSCGGV